MNKKHVFLFFMISMTFLPLLNIGSQQFNVFIPQFNVFIPQFNDVPPLIASQGGSIYNNTVIVLMNTTLNGSIHNEVLTYVQDIKNGLKCNASLYVYPNSWNHTNLRNFLNNTYQNFGLRGAILIGQAPAFIYEHTYQIPSVKWFRFPWDYYYMDLDCTFTDTDGNNTDDSMSGNIGPEIWVSRIDAHKLSNEVNLYKDYFARNHLVRNVGSRGAQKGLLWVDDDWAPFPWSFQIDACLGELYPTANRTLYNNTLIPPATNKPEYLSNLTLDYEWFWGCVHSWPDMHQIKPSLLTISWLEINQTQKNAEFFNLYNCKAGNFTYPNYLAGWYIFGNTSGQVSISCAREGGFWYGTHDFYKDLSGGDSIGDAWKEMYLRGYKTSKYPTGFREPFPTFWQWMGNNIYWGNYTEGTNLFGDPTLQNCRKPTNITIKPIPDTKLHDNMTIIGKITDPDGWSLYNVSLSFKAFYSGSWNTLGTELTNITGYATHTFNTTGLPTGPIPIEVEYAGTINFFNSSKQTQCNIYYYPTLNPPLDINTTTIGSETINWTLWDSVGTGKYRVWANDTNDNYYIWQDWSDWTNDSNLAISINRTAIGVFNYTIEYNNSNGLFGTPDTVMITVMAIPTSNNPGDINTAITGSETINWTLWDSVGTGKYRVWANDTNDNYYVWQDWSDWTNDSNLAISINRTAIGVFNYTIEYNNSNGLFGNINSVMVNITQTPLPPPSDDPLIPLEMLLVMAFVGQPSGISPIYIGGAVAAVGFLVVILILVVNKKKK